MLYVVNNSYYEYSIMFLDIMSYIDFVNYNVMYLYI